MATMAAALLGCGSASAQVGGVRFGDCSRSVMPSSGASFVADVNALYDAHGLLYLDRLGHLLGPLRHGGKSSPRGRYAASGRVAAARQSRLSTIIAIPPYPDRCCRTASPLFVKIEFSFLNRILMVPAPFQPTCTVVTCVLHECDAAAGANRARSLKQ